MKDIKSANRGIRNDIIRRKGGWWVGRQKEPMFLLFAGPGGLGAAGWDGEP